MINKIVWSILILVLLILIGFNAVSQAASTSSETRPTGLYFWDGEKVIDLGNQDALLKELSANIAKIDRDFYGYRLASEFRIARLEIIIRKVHPNENGFIK